jgi:hypothetical protein
MEFIYLAFYGRVFRYSVCVYILNSAFQLRSTARMNRRHNCKAEPSSCSTSGLLSAFTSTIVFASCRVDLRIKLGYQVVLLLCYALRSGLT